MTQNALCLGLLSVALTAGCSADVDALFGNTNAGGNGAGAEGGANQGGAPSSDGGSTSNTPGPTTSAQTTTTNTSTNDGATVTSTVTGLPPQISVDCQDGPCVVEDGGACCFDLEAETSTCEASGECGDEIRNTIVTIQCQTPDDCGGEICCAHRELPTASSPYGSTECVSRCSYPDLYLCDINAPDCPIYDTVNGPVQSVCKQSTLLPSGYYVCGLQ